MEVMIAPVARQLTPQQLEFNRFMRLPIAQDPYLKATGLIRNIFFALSLEFARSTISKNNGIAISDFIRWYLEEKRGNLPPEDREILVQAITLSVLGLIPSWPT